MGISRFSIYKYVRTSEGWRYCKPVYRKNNKPKPDVVLVGDNEETHPEEAYYVNLVSQWVKCGISAAEAQDEQNRRLAEQRYEHEAGEKLPEPKPTGMLFSDAVASYLDELELKVAGKSRSAALLL